MTQKRRVDIKACVFDAYGTLFDFASAAAGCSDALGDKSARLTALWREKQLQYTWLRAAQGRHADFWQVTGEALDYALETLDIADTALRLRLMTLYLALNPFPDAPGVLARLKSLGMKTAILSNGTPAMLEACVKQARLEKMLDAVLSVEEVGVYKPSERVYQLAVERLEVPAAGMMFVSSNAWDTWAAAAFGMRAAWCNRDGRCRERLPGAPEWEVRSLAELPGLLEGLAN